MRPRSLKPICIAAGLAAAGGIGFIACGEGPTQLTVPDRVVAPERSTASATYLPSALIPVEDALVRILEVLPEQPEKEELREVLAELAEALYAEDSCGIRTHRKTAEHALRDLSRRQPKEYEADFEVVKLALGSVEQPGKGKC